MPYSGESLHNNCGIKEHWSYLGEIRVADSGTVLDSVLSLSEGDVK